MTNTPFIYRFLTDDNYSEAAAKDLNDYYGYEKRPVREYIDYESYEAVCGELEQIKTTAKKFFGKFEKEKREVESYGGKHIQLDQSLLAELYDQILNGEK